jgi:hypothetical protein
MPVLIRGKKDPVVRQIAKAFQAFQDQHPSAQIEVYREYPYSVRVRVVDKDFEGMDWADRHDLLWQQIETLPESVQSHLSILLALTPKEKKTSLASLDFDNPIPSNF